MTLAATPHIWVSHERNAASPVVLIHVNTPQHEAMMIIETTSDDYAALTSGRALRDYKSADSPIAPPEVLEMLAGVAAHVRETFSPASWLIVEGNEVVGLCSITRPPRNAEIDIGYGIAPTRQGRGIAGRAIGDIVDWALGVAFVKAITAETAVENLASQRVLRKNGFIEVNRRVDEEDGALICWRRNTV
jgi:RimJ/RimL family protein N-acetyltransferase